MRRNEWVILVVLYVCATVSAFAIVRATKTGDLGLAGIVAAIVATQAAGWLYHRRNREASPIGFRLLVGGTLVFLWLATAVAIQWMWPVTTAPDITIIIGLIGTALMPLLLMGMMPKMYRDAAPTDGSDAIGRAVLLTCGAAVAVAAASVAWMTVAKRDDPPLVARQFPGLEIAVPQWHAGSDASSLYEHGRVQLDDPDGRNRFITVGWEEISPGEDAMTHLFAGMGAKVAPVQKISIAGHDARLSYMLDSDTGARKAAMTDWSCDQDGRWVYVMTFTNQPAGEMAHTHERIMRSVRCHTTGPRKPAERVLPAFDPPTGSVVLKEMSDDPAGGAGWATPNDELIILSRATPGRNELLGDDVSADMIGKLLLGLRVIDRDRTTDARWVIDTHGHRRRTWTVSGAHSDGTAIQGEVMAWHCDVRNYSFLAFHLKPAAHDAKAAVDLLLTARCHEAG